LGVNSAGTEQFLGLIDEARVSTTARSADWIATEYNNEGSPSTFYSVGSTETSAVSTGAPPALVVSPASLTYSGVATSANPAAQPLSISSSNGVGLGSWSASVVAGSFAGVSNSPSGPFGGSISGSGAATIYVQVDNSGLAAGPHSATLMISSSAASPSSQPVHVLLTLSAPTSGTAWANGYSYRGTITIAHGQVPNSDQTNFPVLFSGNPDLATRSNGGKVISPNGYDIIFTSDSNGLNKLNSERESYSPKTGQGVFWVQVPTLSHTIDTVLYVFYGNPLIGSDQSNRSAVWDTNYQGVWHVPDGTVLSANDSTSNHNDGSITNATPVAGEIGGGANLNGSAWIDMGANVSSLHPTQALTVECWVNPTSSTQPDFAVILAQDYSYPRSLPWVSYKLGLNNNNGGNYEFELTTNGGNTVLDSGVAFVPGSWAHVVGTFDGSTKRIYINGVLKASAQQGGSIHYANTGHFVFGANSSGAQQLAGLLDEGRISDTARSADWIAAEYNNESSPSTFYSVAWGEVQ
jgi:hypothetical protein